MKNPKILIIRNDKIGDLVWSTAVFREIKKALPNSKITAIVSPSNFQLVEKNNHIDSIRILDIPKYSFKTILEYLKMSFSLRKEKFDYGIDLRGSLLNSFFLLYLPGIKKRISRADNHKLIFLFLTTSIIPDAKQHILKDNLEIINRGLSLKSKNFWPEIVVSKEDERELKRLIERHKLKKYICICPLASNKFKQWPLENFKQLISFINKSYPKHKILLFGTKKEEGVLKDISKNKNNCVLLIDTNLRVLSLLFRKSSLVIAQDGGPFHIAWTSKSKTIGIFPKHVYMLEKLIPIKSQSIVLRPCIKDEKFNLKDDISGIEKISVDEVIKNIKKMPN